MPTPPPLAKRTFRRINQLSNAKLIRLLLEGVLDCKALAAESGIHYTTVLSYVAALRTEGAVYIDHWEPDARGAMRVKVYRLGVGVDALQPTYTNAERSKRYRENKKGRALHHAIANPDAVGNPYWPAI